MRKLFLVLLFSVLISEVSVNAQSNSLDGSYFSLNRADFQKTIRGKQCGLYFLNNGDLKVAITNYGARIVSLCAPSSRGEVADLVVGFKSIDDYLKAKGVYHGAVIGRVAGRVAEGKFDVNGKSYQLPVNNGRHQLHGGAYGFHNQVWDVKTVTDTSIVLNYLSVDGEMGYPGNVQVVAHYSLNAKNELSLELSATTDQSTPVNLTNHAFFNLAGVGTGSMLNQQLTIPAGYICPLKSDLIPTGKLKSVAKTPFDFRKSKEIGKDLVLEKTDDQLKFAGGYDHHFVLSKKKGKEIKLAAIVMDPVSGRKLEVLTDEPCIHLFTANFFNGSDLDKQGKPIQFRESIALETQRFPLLPDQKLYPSVILNPGQKYQAKTIYRFSVVN